MLVIIGTFLARYIVAGLKAEAREIGGRRAHIPYRAL
jgi:hypothetical protein